MKTKILVPNSADMLVLCSILAHANIFFEASFSYPDSPLTFIFISGIPLLSVKMILEASHFNTDNLKFISV